MKHLKEQWPEEIADMRIAISDGRMDLGKHVLYERMVERGISISDIAAAIITGKIVEGYDIGQYPGYRNPDPLRTIVGRDYQEDIITVGVAIKKDGYYVTTVYKGTAKRLELYGYNMDC